MDFTVGIVSQNLATQSNFIEFQDSQNFHVFRSDGCPVDPKNGIFEKILKVG